MELKKAFQMTVDYIGKDISIKVNKDGYICLNDMADYFFNKRLDNWLVNKDTKTFIDVVEKDLNHNTLNSSDYKKSIISQRGKGGGTFAHKYIAFKFAMWLSPEFELNVIKSYENGTQRKTDWNIKRILASENYRLLTEAVKDAHEPAMYYHYSNEADMLNMLVFGCTKKDIGYCPRDKANEKQLDEISYLESRNASFIEIGLDFAERKEVLKKLYDKYKLKDIKQIEE